MINPFLALAIVLLLDVLLSVLLRWIAKKVNRRRTLRNSKKFMLTRGSNGFIGGEYTSEVF